MLKETFVWQHDEIQRELDILVVKAHDDLYDLNRISDQQDKANLLSTDTSVFQLVPRTKVLRIYLAKQLFGKSQRRYIHKYCPNFARSTGSYCGARLDLRDLPENLQDE